MTTRLWFLLLVGLAVGCGGDKTTSPTPVVAAPTPTPTPTPAPTPAPSGPRTSFGAGTWRVGSDIAAGRYFTDPASSCYWERRKGLSGTLADVIANEFISYNAGQWIVDILPSDVAFQSDASCGTWTTSPRPAPSNIAPGLWLVGSQIPAGTYKVANTGSCYWERLRHFQGTIEGIIANDFVSSAGQQVVSISGSDVGFNNDNCGTWTLGSGQAPIRMETTPNIAATRRVRRAFQPVPMVP